MRAVGRRGQLSTQIGLATLAPSICHLNYLSALSTRPIPSRQAERMQVWHFSEGLAQSIPDADGRFRSGEFRLVVGSCRPRLKAAANCRHRVWALRPQKTVPSVCTGSLGPHSQGEGCEGYTGFVAAATPPAPPSRQPVATAARGRPTFTSCLQEPSIADKAYVVLAPPTTDEGQQRLYLWAGNDAAQVGSSSRGAVLKLKRCNTVHRSQHIAAEIRLSNTCKTVLDAFWIRARRARVRRICRLQRCQQAVPQGCSWARPIVPASSNLILGAAGPRLHVPPAGRQVHRSQARQRAEGNSGCCLPAPGAGPGV